MILRCSHLNWIPDEKCSNIFSGRRRDRHGRLQPDKERFPSGMKALEDYVHSLGLKFGIYEDYGNFTCAGYPGILGHLETDADTFASWDVDYVKLDGER